MTDLTQHRMKVSKVLSFYNNKKNELADYFKSAVKSGRRFSLSLDEYTSSQYWRYMNINVHDVNEHWSLGMIMFSHSLNYSGIIEMVSKRLEEFGLDHKVHIVGCTTDGASIMVKFGKEITSFSYHQQCIAHCIHLAVCDILYSKVNKSSYDEGHNYVTVKDEIFEEDKEIEENQDMTDPLFENVCEKNEAPQITEQYSEVIAKVRRICRMFLNSPLKNDKNEFNEELKLILDCKVRWNSLLAMIERFLKLKNCISKALLRLLLLLLLPLLLLLKTGKNRFSKVRLVKTGFQNSDYLATLLYTTTKSTTTPTATNMYTTTISTNTVISTATTTTTTMYATTMYTTTDISITTTSTTTMHTTTISTNTVISTITTTTTSTTTTTTTANTTRSSTSTSVTTASPTTTIRLLKHLLLLLIQSLLQLQQLLVLPLYLIYAQCEYSCNTH